MVVIFGRVNSTAEIMIGFGGEGGKGEKGDGSHGSHWMTNFRNETKRSVECGRGCVSNLDRFAIRSSDRMASFGSSTGAAQGGSRLTLISRRPLPSVTLS